MPNNSSTGGYLDPSGNPLEDDALTDFLQAVIAGVSGMAGANIRPRWQPKSPNLPDYGTDWAAIGITEQTPDTFAYVLHTPDVGDKVVRSEIIQMLVSFYGPHAGNYSNILSMGFQVDQNREVLLLAGMGLIEVQPPRTVPEVIKGQWWNRVDQLVRFRRAITRTYPILNLLTANGFLVTDVPATSTPITVTE